MNEFDDYNPEDFCQSAAAVPEAEKISEMGIQDYDGRFLLLMDSAAANRYKPASQREKNLASLLLCGYVDSQYGASFIIVGWNALDSKGNSQTEHNPRIEEMDAIRRKSITECSCLLLPEMEIDQQPEPNRTEIKLILKSHAPTAQAAQIRTIRELNSCRNADFPELISVYFLKPKLKPERALVRVKEIQAHSVFSAELRSEPRQNFGLHKADHVVFWVEAAPSTDDMVCICRLRDGDTIQFARPSGTPTLIQQRGRLKFIV